jgi:hypothetical protein
MRSATPRRPSAPLALLAALAGAVCAYQPVRAVEAAPADAGESATSVPIPAYAWPTELAPEPKEEDWAGATVLAPQADVRPEDLGAVCERRALGGWLRITCTPSGGGRLGVLWGLAGDDAKVKGRFVLASEVEHYTKPPKDMEEDFRRKMGASATITLPITPGSALLLRLDWIVWDEGYDWAGVVSRPGMFIDVSWALGERSPTILYR